MQDWLLSLAAFLGGALLLIKAGDWLVRYAAQLAVAYHVPKTVVGAVVLGFGTSLPELFVSLSAALKERPGIALGNVVGSNIANIGLILGCGALLATLHVKRNLLRSDLPLGLAAAVVLLVWVGPAGEVSQAMGAALLAGFIFYLLLSVRHTRRFRAIEERELSDAGFRLSRAVFFIVAGLVGIAVGAELLVYGAGKMAHLLGVDERVIGLSLVALSTSLPELAAMVAAARKGEADLAVGNVAGSNLFNLLFVLGTTAAIHPIRVPEVMHGRDFPVLVGFAVLAFPLFARRARIRRMHGLLLVGAWAAYMAWTWGSRP